MSAGAGCEVVQLPASVRSVDFVSDLHLSPALPHTTATFYEYLARTRADALVLLGDVFEAWIGDDALEQPYEARCVDALKATANRMPLWIMRGNRDFLLGPAFFSAAGARALADPTLMRGANTAVLLSHGDALCTSDVAYQAFRAQVRQPVWRSNFLARPLAERQAMARQMRDASQAHQRQTAVTEATCDIDPALARRWLVDAHSHTLVHGHTHRPASEQHDTWTRHVLSDWDLDHAQRAEVLRWTDAGFQRLTPERA